MTRARRLATGLSICLLAAAPGSFAAEPCRRDATAFPGVRLTPVAAGLRRPVHAAAAFDGNGRLFVVEQAGVVRVIQDGRLTPRPFLDIRGRVRSGGEMGLLSVAFHPRFKENGRLFVNYTSGAGGLHTVVSEFQAGPHGADPTGERVLFTVEQPYSNHNGGQNAFGPDGRLYIGTGDGGSGNDPHDNGQRLDTLLGKMLRIDVDKASPGKPYGIPPDNPFAKKGGAPEVYAWGLRNPWRFSFDPVTGLLYAADVGQNHWEEIDVVEKGKNYGWRVMEGRHCTPGVGSECSTTSYEPPIHEYGRKDGISVTGGFVYRGSRVPGLCGAYVFGDYGSGRIWALRYDGASRRVSERGFLLDSGLSVSSFGEGEDRELYVLDYGGRVLRLDPAPEPGAAAPRP